MTFLTLPIITRNISPAEYGLYSQILFIVATLLPLATLKIEILNMTIEDVNESRKLLNFAIFNSIGLSLIILPVFSFIILILKINVQYSISFYVLIAFCLITQAFVNIVNQQNMKSKKYTRVMQGSILQNAMLSGLQILFTILKPIYQLLIISYIIGRAMVVLREIRIIKNLIKFKLNMRQSIETYKKYRKKSMILTLGSFLETFFYSAISTLISLKYGSAAAGYLGLALILYLVPTTLIGSSFSSVIFSEFQEKNGENTKVRSLMLFVLIISIGIAVVVSNFFPLISDLYLSETWKQSSNLIKYLAVPIGINILWITCTNIYIKSQKFNLYLGFMIARILTSIFVGYVLFLNQKSWQVIVIGYFVSGSFVVLLPTLRIYSTLLTKRTFFN